MRHLLLPEKLDVHISKIESYDVSARLTHDTGCGMKDENSLAAQLDRVFRCSDNPCPYALSGINNPGAL